MQPARMPTVSYTVRRVHGELMVSRATPQPKRNRGACSFSVRCVDGHLLPVHHSIITPNELDIEAKSATLKTAQSQRAKGAYEMARRRWQQGSVYSRRNKQGKSWSGRYFEPVATETSIKWIQRNRFLGCAGSDPGQLTKAMAQRLLQPHVDRANNYQPETAKSHATGKGTTLFSVFADRWRDEILIHKKASTRASMTSNLEVHILPRFGNTPVGDIDSERVQSFLI